MFQEGSDQISGQGTQSSVVTVRLRLSANLTEARARNGWYRLCRKLWGETCPIPAEFLATVTDSYAGRCQSIQVVRTPKI